MRLCVRIIICKNILLSYLRIVCRFVSLNLGSIFVGNIDWFSNIINSLKHYGCLPARMSTEKSNEPCGTNSDCNRVGDIENVLAKRPSLKRVCIHSVWDNKTRLIRIEQSLGDSVLYVGSVKELIYSGRYFESSSLF